MVKHAALVVAAILIGSASAQLMPSYSAMLIHSSATTRAAARFQAHSMQDRADLRKALDIYQTLLDNGLVGLKRPVLEDPASVQRYLDAYPEGARYEKPIETEPVSTTDYVAPEVVGPRREQSELDRQEYRRALKTRTCFVSLPTGLRELCERVTRGRKPSNLQGVRSDLIPVRGQSSSAVAK